MKLLKSTHLLSIGIILLFSSTAQSIDSKQGLLCVDQDGLNSEWTETDQPVNSVIGHWFEEGRVFTTSWLRENDVIIQITERFGKKYSTDSKFIFWPLDFFDDENKIVEINRADATRSIKVEDEIIVTVACSLFVDQKEFDEKIAEIKDQIQESYNKAISDHKI